MPKVATVAHYAGELAKAHLAILLPAARLAEQALIQQTPVGLYAGSPLEALSKAIATVDGVA